uniref:Uncharacterized protein n=1 Tax=Panagrolaimus sp. PS1159 TaxID=55785 RepID=A0AC35GAY1_9BILA
MLYTKYFVVFVIASFYICFTETFNLSLVESCTAKVKNYFLKNEEAQNDYRALLDDGGDAVGFQLQIINQVCDNSEIPDTVEFFNKNSKVLSELTAFTSTLNETELDKFIELQKSNEFAEQIKFIKDKYDVADAKDKNKLRTLMHNLVPLLLQNQNVSDAVLKYFNTITPDDLVKIIDIAEDHNTIALETYMLETFNHLGLNEAQRQDVRKFIDSIHNVKNANKSDKSKLNGSSSSSDN